MSDFHEILYKYFWSKDEFCEHHLSDSRTLLMGIHDIFHPKWIKFGTSINKNFNDYDARKYWCSESHTLHRGINEYLSIFSTLIVSFR